MELSPASYWSVLPCVPVLLAWGQVRAGLVPGRATPINSSQGYHQDGGAPTVSDLWGLHVCLTPLWSELCALLQGFQPNPCPDPPDLSCSDPICFSPPPRPRSTFTGSLIPRKTNSRSWGKETLGPSWPLSLLPALWVTSYTPFSCPRVGAYGRSLEKD